eukprot:3741888-Amphidinium_carterae.3
MNLMITTLHSHFGTNIGVQARTTMDNDIEMEITLTATTLNFSLKYATHIEGDTEEDIRRLREMQDVDDDMQSQLRSR